MCITSRPRNSRLSHVFLPSVRSMSADQQYMEEYDEYNYGVEYTKMEERMKTGGHAKHKDTKEKQKFSPSGNVRKVVSNIQNAERKDKEMRKRTAST